MTLTAHSSRAQALLFIARSLSEAGVEDPHFEARLLLQFCTGLTPIELITNEHIALGPCYANIPPLIARRLNHEPLSRIIGRRGFWTIDMIVGPDVLDPRPDSETLIRASLSLLQHRLNDRLRIADLGTGSGALLCALLSTFPYAEGIGVDLSTAACALAQKNLLHAGLNHRAHIQHSDWRELKGQFDLIISNPPYIKSSDIDALAPSVRHFDPILALDGGADGLDAYRALMPIVKTTLKPAACLILEIGATQAQTVSNLLKYNDFMSIAVHQDMAGRDRAITAWFQSA